MIDLSRPMCPCGYELVGLAGPPWKCPECGGVTRRWPARKPPVAMTSGERKARRLSLVIMALAPILAPWFAAPVTASLLALGGLGVLLFAGTLVHWLVRGEPWPFKLLGVMPFLITALCGTLAVGVLLVISMMIRSAL